MIAGLLAAGLAAAGLAAPAWAEDAAEDARIAGCIAEASDDAARAACIGQLAGDCMATGPQAQTTIGMAECLQAEFAVWDRLLNAGYAEVMAAARAADAADGASGAREDALRIAQRAWIAFRDADCAEEAGIAGSGSIRLIIGPQCMMQHTAERSLDLIAKLQAFEPQ